MRSNRCFIRLACLAGLLAVINGVARAQGVAPETMRKIMDRLDTLEKQNETLLAEIQALRDEMKKAQPQAAEASQNLDERLNVAEERIKEQSQSKVSSSQRLPVSLTGMFLFDAFATGGDTASQFFQTYPEYGAMESRAGATLRQSIIGLEFHGPHIFADGRVSGSLSMDFYGRSSGADIMRIRRGTVSFDWARRSVTFGQDKSLIAPLAPTSFAHVGVPALAGAGNLWLWLPQARYEERVPFSPTTQASFQAGLIETDETNSAPAALPYAPGARPALQVRGQLQHLWSDNSKIALGFGGHVSSTHLLGRALPSRVISADLQYNPLRWLELSSTLLRGENFANLGGVPTGITLRAQSAIPIHGTAGWLQLALPVTNRLKFDLYAGRQFNRASDLTPYGVLRTLTYAGNILYQLGPNMVVGVEASRDRIEYLNRLAFSTNRYDATVAYLF